MALCIVLANVLGGPAVQPAQAAQAQSASAQGAIAQSMTPLLAADVEGSAFPRDVDTGTPSLNSDSLVIQLSGIAATPPDFSVQGYLLENTDGLWLGELMVNAGVINAARDFPGINLPANYSNFRLMWERTLFEDTLPPAALENIRAVVYQAEAPDKPDALGYGVGLLREVNTLVQHANFARQAANSGRLGGTRLHTEHTINILVGESDARHMDYNGDGRTENPGDDYGVLVYADAIYTEMSAAAESEGVTDHIADQAFAVLDSLSNFSPATDSGTWADELLALAQAVLDAETAEEAAPHAVAMHQMALRIRDGQDADGGAWAAFQAAQRAADYFPEAPITGSAQHARVGTSATGSATSDKLVIAFDNVPQPSGGYGLWGYLVDDEGNQLFLGELPWSEGAVEVELAFPGRNLIGRYNQFRMTEGTLYAQSVLPVAPLTEIRKALALAEDTPGGVGYGPGLMQAAQQLRDRTALIQAALGGNDLSTAQDHAATARGLLTGEGHPDADGFGALGYAAGLDLAMQQAGATTGATANIIDRAAEARAALANFYPAAGGDNWSDDLLTQLQTILDASSAADAVDAANQAATLAGQILNGEGEQGGARAAYLAAQRTAEYFPGESGATDPDAPVEPGPNPDDHENDDLCGRANAIPTDGTPRAHTFHYAGDEDWTQFTAQAGKSYVIEVAGEGESADPVIFLYDTCASAPGSFESNAFGNTVRLTWNATRNGPYFIQLRQFDPAVFGEGTEYTLSVTLDTTPPAPPTDLRCLALDPTTVALQWQRSPEPDVAAYQVAFRNEAATDTGIRDVEGAGNTFVELDGLTADTTYLLTVRALDYSRNESDPSGEIPCAPAEPTDSTDPVIGSMQPALSGLYTTTAPLLTVSGAAQDAGNNLSRVRVHNSGLHQDKSDFSLADGASEFRIEDIPLRIGSNPLEIQVFDEANNSTTYNVEVVRLGESPGAVIIVAGHNETFGLQTNIYNAANRAYRVFRSAGFTDDDIYYLAPVGQDATGDGLPDTRNVSLSPAAVQEAITTWAKSRVGPDKPFFLYFMDHGFADKYCVTGCTAGNIITPAQLNTWIEEVEDDTGVEEVNIFIEACQSGSFLDNLEGDTQAPGNGLARTGRVVVTSTGRVNNAYASADGAYFSDTFFSCLADSQSIKACFDEGLTTVALAGVDQTPWLDDNADGTFSSGDGSVADERTVTSFFSSVRPRIMETNIEFDGTSGVLSAQVEPGAEALRLVWAAVYPPGFAEPGDVTLNLNVPLVRLEPVEESPGEYRFDYTNGFVEEGEYRIIFYAQDRVGIHATPVRFGDTPGTQLFAPHISHD